MFQEPLENWPVLLDWLYWSLAAWPVGYFVSLPLYTIMGGYEAFVMLWTFVEAIEGKGSWGAWFAGPVWKSFMAGLIYEIALTFSTIPGIGVLTSWGSLLWAKADYYNYGPWPESAIGN